MAFKQKHLLRSQLLITVHAGSGNPVAFRLNVQKISLLTVVLSIILLVSISGGLLFFRELEINRKLGDRLLEFEVKQNLMALNTPATPTSAAPLAATQDPARNLDAALPVQSPSLPDANASGRARLAELNADCDSDRCSAKMALVPSAPGTATGQIVVVLETEIPRIGTANANVNIRKRYFIYPGYTTRDELTADDIGKIEGKTFKFTRALTTSADFEVGHLLRPLAMNIYLYDEAHTLIQHERKVIDTEEEYDH